jgi:hypothetical protein
MDDGTCKTCAHWQTYSHTADFGDCKASSKTSGTRIDRIEGDIILGEYAATGKDFGCIHHTPKEPTPS